MDTATSEFCFGAVRLDVEQRRLLVDGQPAKLGARAFDVLLALIERRDRTISKNELFDLVWPGVVVEENNLQVHISALRKLLGPQVIATIPGRGYRFTAKLDSSSSEGAPATPPRAAVPPQPELFGRADDMSAVTELLHEHALVTVIGAGGIGKTRLAEVVAATQRDYFSDGLWWVELSQLNDGSLVAAAIAQVLGVRASDDRPVLQTVISLLRNQHALLVLDNCEHLLDAVSECASALLSECHLLRLLVTAQEALHASEEHVYRLRGLPTNSASGTPAAVALFVARAQAADPRLRVSDSHLTTIAEICRRLDGMPLAIELAAARVRVLGIDGVRARLDERFRVLSGGTRTTLRRHQTLRATLEWSYNLLSPEEQTLFRRLGVFVGGFTLELAHSVAGDERIDEWALLDLLGHLIDKSIVVAEGDEVPRYRLLETTRAFALEQLAAAGETSVLLRRHAEALLEFLRRVDDQRWVWPPEEQTYYGAELDNLRAALDWAESTPDHALACELFANSRAVWWNREMMNEGIERGRRLLPLPDQSPTEVDARFNLTLGILGYPGGRRECFDAALRAAELYRSLSDTPRLIDSLAAVALVGAHRGEAETVAAALAEADSLIDEGAPPRQRALLALAHARHFMYVGEYEKGIAHALRQVEIYERSGLEWGKQIALTNVAWFGCALGRVDQAIEALQAAIIAMQKINASYGVGIAQMCLACAHALRGDREQALVTGRAAVPYLKRAHTVAQILPFIALLHAQQPRLEVRAAALIGYFNAEWTRARHYLPPFAMDVRDKVIAIVQCAIGIEATQQHMAAGATLTEERALVLAFDCDADFPTISMKR